MASIKTFNKRMNRRAVKLNRSANQIKRETALLIDQILVVETPYDTRRAASNWLVGINNPPRKIVEPRSTNETISEGRTTISKVQGPDTIWISNNVPYIEALNAGSSTQRPAGFVERAIQTAVAVIKSKRNIV